MTTSQFLGISIFVCYLILKPLESKNSIGTVKLIAGKDKKFIPYPKVLV